MLFSRASALTLYAAAGVLVAAMVAAASPRSAQAASPGGVGPGDAIILARSVLGPLAYTHFCLRYPEECRSKELGNQPSQSVELTPARDVELATINARVNRSITPMRHVGNTTHDTWRVGPRSGDCNDYAVTKRHWLLKSGWPSAALLLSEVVTPWGEHHLVLLARTSAGDLVLDNLDPRVRPWRAVPYAWVRVQMPSEPSLWSTVQTARAAGV